MELQHEKNCPKLNGHKKVDESTNGTFVEYECQDCGKKTKMDSVEEEELFGENYG